jgi:hypothetical protein
VFLLVAGSVALYAATASLALLAAHRWISPLKSRAAFVLALLPLLFTGRAALTGGVFGPVDVLYAAEPFASVSRDHGIAAMRTPLLHDVEAQMFPWHKAVREAVKDGGVPLWNPFLLAGEPLLAVQQPAVLHPATWVGLLLPLPQAWTLLMSLRLFLALLSAYLFLRDLGCGEAPSFLGAAAWGFSDFLVFWLGFPLSNATAPFPLLLLGLYRTAKDADRRSVGLTAFALFLIAVAGHPETLLFTVAGGGVFFLFQLAFAGRGRRLRAVLLGCAAGAAALGLTAVQLLPFVEALPRSFEHGVRSAYFAPAKKAATPEESARRSLPILMPFAYGESGRGQLWKDFGPPAAYAGSIVFPLAFTGLLSRNRQRWALLALAVVGVAVWMRLPFVTDALTALPLFDISLTDYLVFLAVLGLAGLAALGAESLSRGDGVPVFVLGACSAAVAIAVLFGFRKAGMEGLAMSPDFLRARLLWEIVPLALAAALVVGARRPPRRGWIAPILLGLLLSQRSAEAGGLNPTYPAAAFYPPLPLLDAIPRNQPYRFGAVGYLLIPNAATLYELEDVRGYEAMTLRTFVETYPLWCVSQPVWYNRIDDLSRPFLSFLGVRHVLAPTDHPAPPGWTRIARDRHGDLLENSAALPRAFVPAFLHYQPDRNRRIVELGLVANFAEWGVVGASPPPGSSEWVENGPGRVTVTAYSAQAMSLEVEAAKEVIVGTSVTAWPGWKARLDGLAIDPLSYNHAFLAFRVPKGRHRLDLRYRPESFRVGASVSILTLGVLLVALRRRGHSMTSRA